MGTSGTLLGSARQVGWHAALLLWPRLWDLLVDIWLTAAQRRKVTAFHGSLDIGRCPPASCPQCPPWENFRCLSVRPLLGGENRETSLFKDSALGQGLHRLRALWGPSLTLSPADTQSAAHLPANEDIPVFRKLISFQPSQLGRTNMHYSKLPRTALETEFKQNVGPPPKDLTTEVYFPSIKFRSDLPVVFYSQYFKHPICVGEYGPKNGAERQIEEQKILPTTMVFSRLADCALKSTQIPILGVAM
ncbi:PREDICTED: uncharacterized protein C5orf64 homolog [Colobus angolensis palliatus]|uniref:uncharacterized protein C5orf64 homolog n=1 Tax=Colobus angolensis palliatus TaxID=336983 RepID=UPI0005F44566|nr:PREDICTED: uncharacterized protein C5orf64 homolog [Colobus angolensis palliatus]